jgi:hypothetical protein
MRDAVQRSCRPSDIFVNLDLNWLRDLEREKARSMIRMSEALYIGVLEKKIGLGLGSTLVLYCG